MIEALKDEALIEKVGGRFKLSALIQKRLVSLNKGSRSFVETDSHDLLQVVIQEILAGSIYLNQEGNLMEKAAGNEQDISGLDFDNNGL